jgi:hypothetical protein
VRETRSGVNTGVWSLASFFNVADRSESLLALELSQDGISFKNVNRSRIDIPRPVGGEILEVRGSPWTAFKT